MSRAARALRVLSLASALMWLCACEGDYPRDPGHTLQRVTGATMLVGVTHDPPHLVVVPGREPAGAEADLLRAYARSIDARIRWVPEGQAALMRGLEEGRLHAVAGGHGSRSPWDDLVGFSTPYDVRARTGGMATRHRLAVPPGENAWLMRFERFLRSPAARGLVDVSR